VGHRPWTEVVASESDEDGDNTQVMWRVPAPAFGVNPTDDQFWGWSGSRTRR